MKTLLDILKGIVIGLANAIPGVSGGTMAVGMGIYDKILLAVTGIRKDFKGAVKTLWPYALGAVLGIAVFARLLEYLFAHFPLSTAFAFVGLILGALPSLFRKLGQLHRENDKNRFSPACGLAFLGLAALVIVMPLLKEPGAANTLEPSALHALLAVGLGFIAAFTMVVPGVSGSMVLLLLGYYTAVLGLVNTATGSLLAFNWGGLFSALAILLPFLIGCVLGIVTTAKVIGTLLTRFPTPTYWGILGLVLASPFPVLYTQSFAGVTFGTVIACVLALAGGFVASVLLGGEK